MEATAKRLMEEIQEGLFKQAKEILDTKTFRANSFEEFVDVIKVKHGMADLCWCGDQACEDRFKAEVGATIRCLNNREIDGKKSEPIESLTIEVSPEFVGAVSQELGIRKAELKSQELVTTGGTRFVYEISTAALIGLRNNLLTATKGTVIMSSIPSGYRPVEGKYRPERNGALIASEDGVSTAYALDSAQARGILYIPPQVPVYQGMIIGLSNKKEDIDINICREKQLTNMRTHASDGAIQLTPYTQLSLEQCLDFLLDDELLEVTPKSLRLRKRQLDPIKRKRENRILN